MINDLQRQSVEEGRRIGGWEDGRMREDGGLEEEMIVTEKLEEYGAKLRQNEEKY